MADALIRDLIIENLKCLHGKPFVRAEGEGIRVRHAGYLRGRLVYHIPATMIPDNNSEDFINPVSGFDIPELADAISPDLRKQAGSIKFNFCSSYRIAYDSNVRNNVLNLDCCMPTQAEYVLLRVERSYVGPRAPAYSHAFTNARWNSLGMVTARDDNHCFDIWLLKIGDRATGENQPTAEEYAYYRNQQQRIIAAFWDPNLPMPELIPYTPEESKVELMQTVSDGFTYHYDDNTSSYSSFHFSDEMSEEASYVIDWYGRMLRPSEVKNYLDIYDATVAQLERWTNLPTDIVILYWRRNDFISGFTSCIILQPLKLSTEQQRRISWLEQKITLSWQNRRDSQNMPPLKDALLWLPRTD